MIIGEEFLQTEIRENFEISEMMKRAWAAELEVLDIVDDICVNNGIQYFVDWGTLLGAVRHKGYIPWDDDIDISIKRQDYNRLIKLLPQQLPKGFSMAGMYSESERLRNAAFVTHLRVIADETQWDFNDYMRYFHGFPYQRIGIDIFPLDYIPNNIEDERIQVSMIKHGILILENWNTLKEQGNLIEYIIDYSELCGVHISLDDNVQNTILKVIDAASSMFSESESEYLTNYTYYSEGHDLKMNKHWFDSVINLQFENQTVPVPIDYNNVLKCEYGDYMKYEKNTGSHEYPFYKDMEQELKTQIKNVKFNGSVDEFCRKVCRGELRV